jgi:hypothetical protein
MVRQPIDCAICGDRVRGGVRPFSLRYGVAIWLCADHASADFQRQDEGRAFVEALERVWEANGCLTAARRRALESHVRVFRAERVRPRPGSYTWASLRAEAERLFAAGEPPRPTIDRLRDAVASAGPRPPSVRTMMRWHGERRWLAAEDP